MVFQKKKVRMETLSEYLNEVRSQLRLSVKEVSHKSGIAQKFIEGLESGNFSQLPPDVYVLGFLKQLAEVYAVPSDLLITQFKKERGIVQQVSTPPPPTQTRSSRVLKGLVITPKLLSLGIGAFVLLVVLGYIVWQLISITAAPALSIDEPREGQIVQGGSVSVSGKTDPGATLTINGKVVALDKDGGFKTTVAVASGDQELQIAAQSKFAKTTTKTLKITGELSASPTSEQTPAPANITLRLDFLGETALTLTVDGVSSPTEIQSAGRSKTITGQREIVLSASDGGNIRAFLNNQPLGILGKKGETLNNVLFTAESARTFAPPESSR